LTRDPPTPTVTDTILTFTNDFGNQTNHKLGFLFTVECYKLGRKDSKLDNMKSYLKIRPSSVVIMNTRQSYTI